MAFNDISTFIEKMKMLESTDTIAEEPAEPVPCVHPLVLAMRELQSEGIVESYHTDSLALTEITEDNEIDEEIAYHGSIDDITAFRPRTHFGTEQAVNDRMTYKKYTENTVLAKGPKGKTKQAIAMVKKPVTEGTEGVSSKTVTAYHGTHSKLDSFKIGMIDTSPVQKLGVWFTNSEKAAKRFASDMDHANYFGIEEAWVAKVTLTFKKLVTVDGWEKGLHDLAGAVLSPYKYNQYNDAFTALKKRLLEDGYDGIEILNSTTDRAGKRTDYVVLDTSVISNPDWTEYPDIKWHMNESVITEGTVVEASPDTLEGSFTPDLVESKTWLCKMLAKGLKGKNAGTIYALGSWYGNIGIFLQQAGVQFDKLVLVEPDEESLARSKELLDPLNDDGKLILLHQKAEDVVFKKPGIIINTSCNETGPVFLTKIPKGMLCAFQARNNVDDVLISTDDLQEFDELFPLEKTYYTGEKELTDPETDYTRFMKIGRAGNALSETASTGQGGGSAGSSGGQMVGGPTTYEQEYGMFKRKGPRRIIAMTNEALDSKPYKYDFDQVGNSYVATFVTANNVEYEAIIDMLGPTNFHFPDSVLKKGLDTAGEPIEVIFNIKDVYGHPRIGIENTGDARRVFATVIDVVRKYAIMHKPVEIHFFAKEPSRVKLYDAFITRLDRELPEYKLVDSWKKGMTGKHYVLQLKTFKK